MQRPPQPSSAPQVAVAGHSGVHWHMPNTQRSRDPRVHGGLHPQVSVQLPFTHTEPVGQVMPAQGLVWQVPSTQNWFSAQVTPSQLVCGTHVMWQVVPSAQGAAHG